MSELAARTGARIDPASGATPLAALATPGTAQPGDLTFHLPSRMPPWERLMTAAAGIVTAQAPGDRRAFCVDDVLEACTRISAWLPVRRRRPRSAGEIHASAAVAPGASIAADAAVGEGTVIESGAVIGEGVSIGAFCRIGAGAVVTGRSHVGNRVEIASGCSIGEDGFGFVSNGRRWLRVPSFGSVDIGDDCVILARTVIHAGVLGDTLVGARTVIDSQVLVGHDCRIGEDTAIAGQAALAGAARIGARCRIGGKVGVGEGVTVADDVTVTAMSMVSRSLDEAGASYSSGWPAQRSVSWWRRVAAVGRGGLRA
ncbi:MAG: UDP-3-O-(3-hydroxymyristoyl)glucosamine N-acyltransferase [Gammaproteobacteria bacterium]